MGALFLCPHSSVLPRAPPIYHESIFREYRDALQQSDGGASVRRTFSPAARQPQTLGFDPFLHARSYFEPNRPRNPQLASQCEQDSQSANFGQANERTRIRNH